MKKVLLVAAMLFAGMFTYCNAQDVKVNINNNDTTTTDDCAFKINGICSSEDIGGVDVEFKSMDESKCDYYAIFTNYNTFPVTVIAICTSKYGGEKRSKTINIVLGVNGMKEIKLEGCWAGSVEGMIVRKLAQ